MSKQKSGDKTGFTEILLEFELSLEEIRKFYEEIGSKLNGTLPVSVKLSFDKQEITISKQGTGGAEMTKKANRIANFVSTRVNFDYIPAIRTSSSAEDVISELVSKELARLDSDPEYRSAMEKIEKLQEPILEDLSETIRETVSSFLPSVKSVTVALPKDARYRAFRRGILIEVDDGNKTSLERKGDGVKSLVALALMRHASAVAEGAESTVIAIEEPGAHLDTRIYLPC